MHESVYVEDFMQHKFVPLMLCFGAEFVELGQVGGGVGI